ncbi:uncharacterized protein LOC124153578 [Ischnura elegans]|uniref:uncharacterized protein LOC124153578 n=1 Tax=Ischnura elegans TaxID=197161 RepID=UPI001ED88AF8|nr:uncharacterized protein LOC124153578 [Ischnura elegans]
MASNLLNNQLKQLQRLRKDVENLDKQLDKVLDGVEERKASQNIRGRKVTKRSKSLSCDARRSSRQPNTPKSASKNKGATVEVTVKTKRREKPNRPNKNPDRDHQNVSKYKSTKRLDDIASEGQIHHCCCPHNTEKTPWSHLLKNTETNSCGLKNSQGERPVSLSKDILKRRNNNLTKHALSKDEHDPSKLSLSESGEEISGSEIVSNDLLNSRKRNREDSKLQNIPQLSNFNGLKTHKTINVEDESNSNDGSLFQPINSLCILMEELRRATANQPTKKLVQDMEAALKKMCKVAAVSSEASNISNLSLKKTENRAINTEPHLKVKGKRMEISCDKPRSVANAMVQVPCVSLSDSVDAVSSAVRTKEGKELSSNDPVQKGQRKLAVAEKFELLVKVNDDDSGSRKQYTLGNDEKLKAEIEYLNKQLNLQLKSVEGLSTKESEYHKLISSLIEKVDKLEAQVNEQTKVSQHFYGQCNALLEQNSVIPKMENKLDLLTKLHQNTMNNYEKLKIEFCLIKLEKDKLHDLNCEKDKEINRFKEEIIKIQRLVGQQMQNIKSYVGFSAAAEKVDTLLSAIDSQSNIIKTKIISTMEPGEVNISTLDSSSNSSPGPLSRPSSPFTYSVKLSSPNNSYKPSNRNDTTDKS